MIAINPVFVLIVLLCGIALWFLLRHTFKHIGGAAQNLIEDTKKSMELDTESKENSKEDKEA